MAYTTWQFFQKWQGSQAVTELCVGVQLADMPLFYVLELVNDFPEVAVFSFKPLVRASDFKFCNYVISNLSCKVQACQKLRKFVFEFQSAGIAIDATVLRDTMSVFNFVRMSVRETCWTSLTLEKVEAVVHPDTWPRDTRGPAALAPY
eukprot:674981-Rhodomonas_salina.1